MRHIGGYLRSAGLEKGDKVAIVGPNMPEWGLLYLSCILEGLVIVPISYLATKELVNKLVSKVHPRVVFQSQWTELVEPGDFKLETLEYLFDYAREHEQVEFDRQLEEGDLLEILFTSGTTSEPKGVMLSRKNFAAQLEMLHSEIGIDPYPRSLSILPYSHIYEQVIDLLFPIYYSATIFYVGMLTPSSISEALKEYKVTHLVVVPEILSTFTDRILYKLGRLKLDKIFVSLTTRANNLPLALRRLIFAPVLREMGGELRMITLGGAKTDVRVGKLWEGMGVGVFEGYGLTETTAAVTSNSPDHNFLGSSGRLLTGVDVKFSEEDEEILIKGDSVFKGYFERPELNAEVFDEQGYFRTGDVGGWDKNGNLVLKGRQKFRIVLANGEKVYPEDIEFKAKQKSGVKDVCVFAYEKDGRQEVAAAFILGDGVDLAKLIEDLDLELEVSQRIVHYAIWPETEFPRTPTLKLQRKEIAEKAIGVIDGQKQEGTQVAKLQSKVVDPVTVGVIKILSVVSRHDESQISGDLILSRNLRIDSLKRLSILILITDEFEVSIPESSVTSTTTVKELVNLVKTSPKTSKYDLNHLGWKYSDLVKWMRRLAIKLILRSISGSIDPEFIGLENIPEGPAIYISNHPGMYDLAFLIEKLFARGKSIFVFADGRHWQGRDLYTIAPILSFLVGALPVDKQNGYVGESLLKTGKLIEEGYSLVLAPQGVWTLNDAEKLTKLRPGTAAIAKSTRCSVVPCYIDTNFFNLFNPNAETWWTKLTGTENILPLRSASKKVKFIVGEPILIPSYLSDSEAEQMLSDSLVSLHKMVGD